MAMAEAHRYRFGQRCRIQNRVAAECKGLSHRSFMLSARFNATSAFWDCANQIERWAGKGYERVLWFLVSDSLELRCRCNHGGGLP